MQTPSKFLDYRRDHPDIDDWKPELCEEHCPRICTDCARRYSRDSPVLQCKSCGAPVQ